jgi:hypothetical protein
MQECIECITCGSARKRDITFQKIRPNSNPGPIYSHASKPGSLKKDSSRVYKSESSASSSRTGIYQWIRWIDSRNAKCTGIEALGGQLKHHRLGCAAFTCPDEDTKSACRNALSYLFSALKQVSCSIMMRIGMTKSLFYLSWMQARSLCQFFGLLIGMFRPHCDDLSPTYVPVGL